MKVITFKEYGTPNVLKLSETNMPAPKENELLIRVLTSSINYGDLMVRQLTKITSRDFNIPLPLLLPTRLEFGFSKPKRTVLGSEFSGIVEAIGEEVTSFKEGDAVFGYLGTAMGANAEYVCVAEDGIMAHMPTNMRFEEATAVPTAHSPPSTYSKRSTFNLDRKCSSTKPQAVLAQQRFNLLNMKGQKFVYSSESGFEGKRPLPPCQLQNQTASPNALDIPLRHQKSHLCAIIRKARGPH